MLAHNSDIIRNKQNKWMEEQSSPLNIIIVHISICIARKKHHCIQHTTHTGTGTTITNMLLIFWSTPHYDNSIHLNTYVANCVGVYRCTKTIQNKRKTSVIIRFFLVFSAFLLQYFSEVFKALNKTRGLYLRWRDLGNAGGAETEWTTTELRNSLRSIEWDLEDLEDTINILFTKKKPFLLPFLGASFIEHKK